MSDELVNTFPSSRRRRIHLRFLRRQGRALASRRGYARDRRMRPLCGQWWREPPRPSRATGRGQTRAGTRQGAELISDIISSRWSTMCIQREYACGCAGPKLEASVVNKMAAGVPMAQAIAELPKARSAKPRKACVEASYA